MLMAENVNGLYPFIDFKLERRVAALQRLMDQHTSFHRNLTLEEECLELTFFIKTNSYVECDEWEEYPFTTG